jgi:hypothetical protein
MLLLDDTAAHATLLFILTRTACCHHTIIACTRRSFTTLTVMGRMDSCTLYSGRLFPRTDQSTMDLSIRNPDKKSVVT